MIAKCPIKANLYISLESGRAGATIAEDKAEVEDAVNHTFEG